MPNEVDDVAGYSGDPEYEEFRARQHVAIQQSLSRMASSPYFAVLDKDRAPWFSFFKMRSAERLHVDLEERNCPLSEVLPVVDVLSPEEDWNAVAGTKVLLARGWRVRRNMATSRYWFGPFPDLDSFAGLVAIAWELSEWRGRVVRLAKRARLRHGRLENTYGSLLAGSAFRPIDKPILVPLPRGLRLTPLLAPGRSFFDGPKLMWTGPVCFGDNIYIVRALADPLSSKRTFTCGPDGIAVSLSGAAAMRVPDAVVDFLNARRPYRWLWYDDDCEAMVQALVDARANILDRLHQGRAITPRIQQLRSLMRSTKRLEQKLESFTGSDAIAHLGSRMRGLRQFSRVFGDQRLTPDAHGVECLATPRWAGECYGRWYYRWAAPG